MAITFAMLCDTYIEDNEVELYSIPLSAYQWVSAGKT